MRGAAAEAIRNWTSRKQVSVGFDGYIDRILRVQGIDSMEQFGNYILQKAGKSCSLEVKLMDERIGGNMPNYASALSALGVDVTCIGALGAPEVSPLFEEALAGCEVYSVSNYGTSMSLEFLDGKVMIAQNQDIERLDYRKLTGSLSGETLAGLFRRSDMITFLNWSEMREATSIWKGIAQDVLPVLEAPLRMMVDFSDCSGKTREQVLEIMEVLRIYAEKLQLCVSLNLNEAEQLAAKMEIRHSTPGEIGEALLELLGAEAVIVHLTDGCTYATAAKSGVVANRVIAKPRLLTGGGDNFNAGLGFGLLLEMDLESALLTANAVSGYYVSHGYSPNREQLAGWLAHY